MENRHEIGSETMGAAGWQFLVLCRERRKKIKNKKIRKTSTTMKKIGRALRYNV